ncbi:MAG: FtsX-like permease family protein [Victivallales bacterium]|nr:FtsX-like permease family protein [Victivallales bacterium]
MRSQRGSRGVLKLAHLRSASIAACLAVSVCHAADGTSSDFDRDLKKFCESRNRLAGTKNAEMASLHLFERLKQIGADEVVLQKFPSVQLTPGRAELRIEGSAIRLELYPLRPNGIITSTTPPEGISGTIVKAGKGTLLNYNDRDVKDSIVVLDYNSGENWLTAFRMGASAVIFTRESVCESGQSLHSYANTNLPRFFFDGDPKEIVDGAGATVVAEHSWAPAVGNNVIALIRGTEPVFDMNAEEAIVIATHIDSFGEVPDLSPGARGAANMAGLIETAEFLLENRPRRNIVVAFLDNQARGHEGARIFYRAIDTRERNVIGLPHRRASLESEQEFLRTMRKTLLSDNPMRDAGNLATPLFDRLRLVTDEEIENSRAEMGGLRLELARLGRAANLAENKDRLEEINDRVAMIESRLAEMRPPHIEINDFRRLLATREMPSLSDNIYYAKTVETVRKDVESRLAELAIEMQALECDERLFNFLSEMQIVLHVSTIFGGETPRWGPFFGQDSLMGSNRDTPGFYSRILQTFNDTGRALKDAAASLETGIIQPGRQLYGGRFLIHSGEVAGRYGIFNMAFGTVGDGFPREGTPEDTIEKLDAKRIQTQMREFSRLIATAASSGEFSAKSPIMPEVRYNHPVFKDTRVDSGALVMRRTRGSSTANRNAAGAIVQLLPRTPAYYNPLTNWNLIYTPNKYIAFDNFMVLRAAGNGTISYGPVWETEYGFGMIVDGRGKTLYVSDLDSSENVRYRLNLFQSVPGAMILPPQMKPGPAMVLEGRTNSELIRNRSYFTSTDGIVFWYCEDSISSIKIFGENSAVALNIGAQEEGAEMETAGYGTGMSLEGDWRFPSTAKMSANDLFLLNEDRLSVMRGTGTSNRSLEEINARAEDLLIEGRDAKSTADRESRLLSSYLSSVPVYKYSRSMLDDLVKSVLVLLALSVPFAFAVERLLIGSTNVYRQISWFVAFFCATFLILFFTHPAFAVANTPIIIFLGFAIIVLSVMVIFIIMQKFEVELKQLQGLASTVHTASVSRFSTVMAAMSMGISTMRRRPVRTALTAITITLLTFTILCFASFGGKLGINTRFHAPLPPYHGVFIHHINWNEINPSILDVIEGRWGGKAVIAPRFWVTPPADSVIRPTLVRCDGMHPANISGILGISEKELSQREDLASVFKAPESLEFSSLVWMNQSLAKSMQVEPGDEVLLNGRRMVVAPFINPTDMASAIDMDRSSILPVDFDAMKGLNVTQDEEDSLAMGGQSWEVLPVDSVVAVSAEAARAMRANLRAITLYTRSNEEASVIAEDAARMLQTPVAGTRGRGVYWHFFGTVLAASGARDLLMPIVLGGLVVFGTMLGSVADREREIYTFSAVGLAPSHVASLFFAEALVFSIVGGMGGYLIAQALLEVMKVLAAFDLAVVPEINYSSTNSIVTILIVMTTVMLSAIYPAIKASRSANPGILRSWKIPKPDGDEFHIVFPFTVSAYDIIGVVSFLKEHFDHFQDTSLGVFMSVNTRLTSTDSGGIGLKSELALAPFDLGVTQKFELSSAPSEIPGIDEVKLKLTRLSGQPRDWQRLNKILLDDLRKQFLIWRSIPASVMETYRNKTSAELRIKEKIISRQTATGGSE